MFVCRWLLEDAAAVALRECPLDVECPKPDEAFEAPWLPPGALRFFDEGGGAAALLLSAFNEKLDMPGIWSFGAFVGAPLPAAVPDVALDDRRVLTPIDFSFSPT